MPQAGQRRANQAIALGELAGQVSADAIDRILVDGIGHMVEVMRFLLLHGILRLHRLIGHAVFLVHGKGSLPLGEKHTPHDVGVVMAFADIRISCLFPEIAGQAVPHVGDPDLMDHPRGDIVLQMQIDARGHAIFQNVVDGQVGRVAGVAGKRILRQHLGRREGAVSVYKALCKRHPRAEKFPAPPRSRGIFRCLP